MIAIPAVVLRDGCCVERGSRRNVTPSRDPAEVVQHLVQLGFSRVHIEHHERDAIDMPVVRRLLAVDGASLQVAVGPNAGDSAEDLFDAGAQWAVFSAGTTAELDEFFEISDRFPGALILSIDASQRFIAPRRWSGVTRRPVFDLVEELQGLDLGGILVAAVQGDGAPDCPDLVLLEQLVATSSHPLFAAGIVRSFEALSALRERGLSGAIVAQQADSGALDLRRVADEFAQ